VNYLIKPPKTCAHLLMCNDFPRLDVSAWVKEEISPADNELEDTSLNTEDVKDEKPTKNR